MAGEETSVYEDILLRPGTTTVYAQGFQGLDLTDATALLDVTKDDGTSLLSLTSPADIVILVSGTGPSLLSQLTASFTDEVTASLPAGVYSYQLTIETATGEIYAYGHGKVLVFA